MSSSSSREQSPTKQLYYSPSHSTTLYRPATTVGFSQQQQQHHSVPDLYVSGSAGRGRFVQTKTIPMSSRSKRASFETLPPPDDEDMEAYEISTDVHHKTLIQIPGGTVPRSKRVNKSHETLSNIVRNEVGLSTSLRDLQKAGTIPKRKKMPPIRSSKGFVQILGEGSETKIPRRQSVSEDSGRRKSQAPNFRTQARASRRGSVAPPVEEVRSKTPSSRRQSVSRPTTLSPIIGTPNKDSELSAASDKDLVLPDSPSRIPISSRSSSRAHSQHREPSPKPKRSPSKDSKSPTSILRKTPISITTSLHRPSNAGASKKNIPVFGSLRKNGGNKVGPAPKNVPAAKKPGIPKRLAVKRNSSLKSETSTDDSKQVSSRKASPDKKLKTPSPNNKRSPSPSKRDPSPAIREPSSTPSKRSSSPAKREKSPPKSESPQDKKMKRLLSKDSFQSKSNDSIRKKTLEKKNSFKKQQSNPDLIKLAKKRSEEDERSINSIASASSIVGVVTKAGEKFKKLVPLTKQNVVSMTTAAVVSQPAQIQTTLTNQLSQAKLVEAKRGSDESTTDPVAIIEHSQKTLESIQKTMSDATEEINKTIEENLTHLKDLGTAISDSPKPNEEKRTHPGMLSKDSKPASSRDLLKKRMEMGTPKGTPKKLPKTPSTPMTPKPAIPVEPTVNVIEKPLEPKPAPMPKADPATITNAKSGMSSEQATAAAAQMETAAKKPETGRGMVNTQQPAAHNQKSSTTTAEESKQQQQAMGMQKAAAMSGSGDGGVGKGLAVGQIQAPVKSNGNNNNNNNSNNGKGGGSSLVTGHPAMPSTSSPAVPHGLQPPTQG